MDFFTVTSVGDRNYLEWVNPAANYGSGRLLWVGGGDGRLYQLDLRAAPDNPTISWVTLGDGAAGIGSPSLDVGTDMIHVGSEAGILCAVEVQLP